MLLKDDKTVCCLCKLTRIEELIPSRDNEIRSAKVCVVNSDEGRSVLLRLPLQHLIPLELQSTSMEDDVLEERENTVADLPKSVSITARRDGRPRQNAVISGELLRKDLQL